MGVNAQTTVPTFVANQVLTADQQNQSARTGVPVFATTVTRDAAFDGAGEKTLAEGQLCYLESTNVVQYYDGAAWATVGPSGSGLTFLSTTSFATATSVSLPTNTFTSTYTNYRVLLTLTAVTTAGNITGRFRTAGTDNTTSRYFQMSVGLLQNGTANNQADSGTTSFTLGTNNTDSIYSIVLDFFQPAPSSIRKTISGSLVMLNVAGAIGRAINGLHDNSGTPFVADSFSFISSAASSMTGTVQAYGYSLS